MESSYSSEKKSCIVSHNFAETISLREVRKRNKIPSTHVWQSFKMSWDSMNLNVTRIKRCSCKRTSFSIPRFLQYFLRLPLFGSRQA